MYPRVEFIFDPVLGVLNEFWSNLKHFIYSSFPLKQLEVWDLLKRALVLCLRNELTMSIYLKNNFLLNNSYFSVSSSFELFLQD